MKISSRKTKKWANSYSNLGQRGFQAIETAITKVQAAKDKAVAVRAGAGSASS